MQYRKACSLSINYRTTYFICPTFHLNPCHFVTSPFRGTPTAPDGRIGRHLGSMFCEHLARECHGADAP